jgi:transcriptional regulator with XRE-family HTH domain
MMQQENPSNGILFLKAWLARKKLTTYKLARLLGIADNTIWHIIHGKRRPGLVTAINIELLTAGLVPCRAWITEEELAIPTQPEKKSKDKTCTKTEKKGKKSSRKLASK